MVKELFNKMTQPMLWTIIIPIAFLITSITILTCSYSYVVFKSDQVSYEGKLGKFTAKASTLQSQLNNALDTNKELSTTVDNLKKSLGELKKICKLPAQAAFTNTQKNILSDKFIDINNSLIHQSNLLSQQKTKLEAVSKDIIQFKETLQTYSNEHGNSKN